MRKVQYVLLGLALLAVAAVSVALVVRSFQNVPTRFARQKPPPAVERTAPAPNPQARIPQAPAPETPPAPDAAREVPTPPPAPAPDASLAGPAPAARPAPAPPKQEPPAGRLHLSASQIEKVRYVLLSHNVMQTEAEDFPLRVGATVPKTVGLSPLPIEVADAVPAYVHYSYVIVRDQIAIVANARRAIEVLIPL